jgi:hypothetical protein
MKMSDHIDNLAYLAQGGWEPNVSKDFTITLTYPETTKQVEVDFMSVFHAYAWVKGYEAGRFSS